MGSLQLDQARKKNTCGFSTSEGMAVSCNLGSEAVGASRQAEAASPATRVSCDCSLGSRQLSLSSSSFWFRFDLFQQVHVRSGDMALKEYQSHQMV